MIRKAFKMSVHPGMQAEYARRHQPIWPKLEETLLAHGVRSYSIFIDANTSELCAYVEFESEERWNGMAKTDVCQRWWKHMQEIMPSHADNSPVSSELKEVFHLEARPWRRHAATQVRHVVGTTRRIYPAPPQSALKDYSRASGALCPRSRKSAARHRAARADGR